MSPLNSVKTRVQRIDTQLREALDASHVEVFDESALHAGHAGAAGGGGHFRVCVVSSHFEGKTRVAAQRLVYAVLTEMMESEIHALALRTFTPNAWQAQRREPDPLRES